MTANFTPYNYYSNYDYNPKKQINKAGIIGAMAGLATGAWLQYGGSEILKRNAEKILDKAINATVSNKKALTKI